MRTLLKILRKHLIYLIRSVSFKKITANIIKLPPNQYLENKVALITGGSSGIGLSIAEAFVRSGASVVITGRNKNKLEAAKKRIESVTSKEKCVTTLQLDSTRIGNFKDAIRTIIDSVGRIDILVNNAGIMGGVKPDDYDNVLETNLKSAYFLSKLIASYIIYNHIKGNILNICSSSSVRPAITPYALSKWGVRGLTLGLAKALCKYGITVNGIAPGPTATPMLDRDSASRIDNRFSPIGRLVMPEEIANMAVFLVSDFGRSIVGDIVYMTGGAGIITFDDTSCEL